MNFRFEVFITEEDYYDFNEFCVVGSSYGKKQLNGLRYLFVVLFILLGLITLIRGNFTKDAFWGIIPHLLIATALFFFIKPLFRVILKSTTKKMFKKGKKPFSPESVIEFNEDCFVETTQDNKTEQRYSSLENISVFEGKVIYLHINRVLAYIIPYSSFESETQYNEFIEFMKNKVTEINFYNSNK